jgi:hypothetical protein
MNAAATIETSRPYVRHSLARWAVEGHEMRNTLCTNHRVRMLHVWSMLKFHAGQLGVIRGVRKQYTELCELTGYSLTTLKRWIQKLNTEGWLTFNKDTIALLAERRLYSHLGLSFDRKIDRKYYQPQKLDNETRTHYWIYLSDVDDNRKRQAYVLQQKIMQVPELKLWVFGVLSSRGYDIASVMADPLHLASILNSLYRQSFVGKESEMHGWLCENRPDVNRSIIGMANAWLTTPSNVSYVKKKIVQQRIAFIQKIGTITSGIFSHNRYCHVRYSKADKATFQACCDDILPRQDYKGAEEFKTALAA